MTSRRRPDRGTSVLPWIERPRLQQALNAALLAPLVVVVAGPGSGKSTMVAEWAARFRPDAPWLGLDAADGSPEALFAAALAAMQDAAGLTADERVLVPPTGIDETVLEAASRALDARGTVLTLVVDNTHVLDRPPAALVDLVERSRMLRLILVGRESPFGDLASRESAGQVVVIDAQDLAFTADEIRRLLAVAAIPADADAVAEIHEITRGWAVGVAMIALQLRRRPDSVSALTGMSERTSTTDRLLDELLGELRDEDRELLMRLSVLDAVTPALAAELAGPSDDVPDEEIARTAAQMSRLARTQFLVGRSDAGSTLVVHPLLQQRLRRMLDERPRLARDLRRRAASWLAREGDALSAMRCAIDARDWSLVGEIGLRTGSLLAASASREALLDEVERIPPHLTRHDVTLAVVLAAAAYCRGRGAALVSHLRTAEELIATGAPTPWWTRSAALLLGAEVAAFTGDVPLTGELATAALDALGAVPSADVAENECWPLFRDAAELLRAEADLWAGGPGGAAARLARLDGPATGREYVMVRAAGLRALGLALSGRPRSASGLAARTLAATHVYGWDHGALTTPVLLAGAHAAAEDGRWEDATRALSHLETLVRAPGVHPLEIAFAALTRIDTDLHTGDPGRARRGMDAFDREGVGAGTAIEDWRTLLLARIEAVEGRWSDAAVRILRHRRRRAGTPPREAVDARLTLLVSWCALVEGRVADAQRDLAWVRDILAADDVAAISEADLLDVALRRHSDRDAAATDLTALLTSTPIGLLRRTYLLAVPALLEITRTVGETTGPAADIARDLSAHPAPRDPRASSAPSVRLTLRERDVLGLLPTLLTAEEIARRLVLSPHTVRQHIKSLYRKLGVSRRRDAVAVAIASNLLAREMGGLEEESR